MSNCKYCAENDLIYEDANCKAFLAKKGHVPGQIIVVPIQHFTIIEQVPDEIIDHLILVSNQLASVLFEVDENTTGTNMIISNGIPAGQEIPHFSINLIPRFEGDGVNFRWESKKAEPDQLSNAKNLIIKSLEYLDDKEISSEQHVISENDTKQENEKKTDVTKTQSEVDYLIKQLQRRP